MESFLVAVPTSSLLATGGAIAVTNRGRCRQEDAVRIVT